MIMEPGDVAGFRAGTPNGHHVVNRSDVVAKLLVVGSRKTDDDAFYSDIDMQTLKRHRGGTYTRTNGEPYP